MALNQLLLLLLLLLCLHAWLVLRAAAADGQGGAARDYT
jgi:hypothetical protein